MSAKELLATRCGIEERFMDATGQVRETSLETRELLLSAMGMNVDSESSAAACLAGMDHSAWQRSLPPVCVVCANGSSMTVDAVLPLGQREFSWRLVLEDGTQRSCVAPLDAGVLAEREGFQRRHFTLPEDIPHGYHTLHSALDGAVCSLIVSPDSCWLPPAAAKQQRLWGIAAQLYLLRSARNWGIGDFTDLRELVKLVDDQGGDIVGLNPLHAMFLDKPEQASPYSPEDRLLLNVLNIDVESLPELEHCPEARQLMSADEFQSLLEACRSASLVDYPAVANLKLQVLKLLFECSRSANDSPRWQEFVSFRERMGTAHERGYLFAALREHFSAINPTLADWRSWPAEYRDVNSSAVARFADEHTGDVTRVAWMQWIADQQLEAAAEAAGHMEIGLYRDLAVGTDPGGAAIWSSPAAVVSSAHVGAPPDIHNPAGQNWGLPPLHPRFLWESGYQTFIDLVRANMRHAGGLRIDHVMALQHLYWVPAGRSAAEGAYVQYPVEDLIGILALESHRNRCLVVGEDLGTVPDGFRERMMKANILSYRVLFFEQDLESGSYHPPASYPPLSIAVTGSHDLPTVRAWWNGSDIELKERLNLYPNDDGAAAARRRREHDRMELMKALGAEKLLSPGEQVRTEELSTAVHSYVARSESLIAMMQIDDLTAEEAPVNVPTTSDEHPNWRRRLSLTLDELAADTRLERFVRIFRQERP